MEEMILKIRPDMSVERLPFPQGEISSEINSGLMELIGKSCDIYDYYRSERLTLLTKENVVLLMDFYPEREEGYNRLASYLLSGVNKKGIPIWGNALLAKRIVPEPERFHFKLGGFSGISLELLEMYLKAAKEQMAEERTAKEKTKTTPGNRAPQEEHKKTPEEEKEIILQLPASNGTAGAAPGRRMAGRRKR